MAGTLFVVATPIGHLEDISARALRVLGEVALVAAEDTRHTGNLLRHFGIPTRLISLHRHNEGQRVAALVERLLRGDSVALVSDAGTPGIADPGAAVVRQARAAGIRIEPIPGPSAVAAAISIAGLEDSRFAFLGFPPTRSKDRKNWLEDLAAVRRHTAIVFFEAPHRVRETIAELANYVESPIIVLRELTKIHEEVLEGLPGALVGELQHSPQGEFTVVVPRLTQTPAPSSTMSDDEIRTLFGQITEIRPSASRRESVRRLASQLGLSTKRVYDATKAD